MPEAVNTSPEALRGFASNVFRSLGVPDTDAAKVAGLMVEADAYGYDTHGVFRLRQYVARLREGGCNPTPDIRVVAERDATALIDGDDGLGHLAMMAACDLAMNKARSAGIGWVGIRRGNHAGPAALYVRPQTEVGMIGLCAAVGSANHVPPFGGTELLLGTNPIAVGAPSSSVDPFILDMATTVAAMGKIKTLAQRGEQMPEGWMVGRDGRPLTDPQRKDEGFLLPIGGPKGFGLSVAIGLLAGTLNGAAFGSDVVDFTKHPEKSSNTGQFVAAIDISAFVDPDLFESSVERIFNQMRDVAPLPDHPAVRLPGDGKSERRKSVETDGIALHPKLRAELDKIASEVGVPPPT
ncbi:Ldh family oxidoreductase [Marivita hallyeonensis]|uniref:Malate/lactate/ureidoglycolate dehydrogenase, LDH2 family n=1 Tax=Marivita hallyeonensis TaxID=996342 RepID=A0A1M5S2I8_9RHOB|nr:Ldh family oxidoreductase [Marivita hallyeonensis]SHH32807.1 Malate/lactate/ureidoglycolate dehydrogenase, LDH2 family [Marivita hallyeonensis]